MKQLILGGVRSGKSHYAEQEGLSSGIAAGQSLWYVATAAIKQDDHEMVRRIELHQQQRDKQWRLIEEPLQLAEVLRKYNTPEYCLLIDCLTVWLTNALLDHCWAEVKQAFLQAFIQSKASVFLVSSEVGSGVIPMGELSRQFVDESGCLHQELALHCDKVSLVIAGLPMHLKTMCEDPSDKKPIHKNHLNSP
ncbi:bifunctional adenosylcobinamide kinase/adenosylcobinamide-phosphate guanylyltransferase [Candidatus Endobugula sertula]|uniref:Bifunctional adenosylcobalamin biosynthesis protein n=1 Tax=Candidatus Endobugula sertula TaxID=62101 RepID=A0A1D2QQQ6_9GAMM|nr:bifunctional adenosylcobinamide kinase/adenosylcobinamide-phosphate guanylyltransferase [Candidatus Endobugula sertula]